MSEETTLPEEASADITTAEVDLDALRGKLARWLGERLGEQASVTGVTRPAHSGMSSISVLFDASWGDGGQRGEFVARMAPDDSAVPVFPGYDFARQFEVMAGVAAHSVVPVPQVRWLESSPAVLGAPFLVMDRVAGQVPVDNPPYVFGGWLGELDPARRRALQDATVDILAAVHAIGELATRFPTLAADAGADSLRRHVENERRYYDWAMREDGVRVPVLEDAFAWLEAHWPAAPSPDVLCWGDARIGNVLYDGTAPAAVLDWESAWLGPRELDLGWFLFFHRMFQDLAEQFGMPGLPELFRPSDVIARYEQASGATVRDLDFYLTYAALRHGIVMARIHRRRMHFGEVEAPANPNEYVMHHAMLAALVDGSYTWEGK